MEPENNANPEQKVEDKISDEPPDQPADNDDLPDIESDEESKDSKEPPKVIPQQGGHKKRRWIWLLVLLLVLAAGAYYWFVMRDSGTPATTNQSTASTSESKEPANTYTPVNVAYAFKDSDAVPYTLYWRLASGGDRTPTDLKLEASEHISGSAVWGANVVFATEKGIYASTDNGKTYKQIIKLDGTEQITSIKLSMDGQTIVYADLPSTGGKNVVKTVGLDGSGTKTLFTSEKAGVIINGYSSDKQQIVYQEGCWNCDGFDGLPVWRDLKANKTVKVISSGSIYELGELAINNDFTTLVYAKSTINKSAPEQGIGEFTAAPYTINTVSLSDNKTTAVASFGAKDEKNTNGTLKQRAVHVGFVAGTASVYYTDDNKLYIVSGDKASLTYEADKPLLYVPHVGNEVIIVGTGDQTADYKLVNYNVATKKSTDIFNGDNNTIIFGVTTK